MQYIQVDGKKWAINLDWEILPSEKDVKKEAKEIAMKNQMKFGLIVNYGEDYSVGFTDKVVKAPVASYYLSLANQEYRSSANAAHDLLDWVVIQELEEEKYWISVIKSGVPAPQYDDVFDKNGLRGCFADLLIHDTYQFFSTSEDIINFLSEHKEVQKKSITEITASVVAKQKFEKLLGIPNHVMIGGGVAMTVAVLLFSAMSYYDVWSAKQAQEKIQEGQRKQKQEAIAKYKSELKVYEEAKITNYKINMDNLTLKVNDNPAHILKQWYELIGNTPVGSHGWTNNKIKCVNLVDEIKDYSCTFDFTRTGLGTNRMLLEDYPTAEIIGNNASVKINLTKEMHNNQMFTLDSIGRIEDWKIGVMSQLQLLKLSNIDFDIKTSVEMTYLNPAKPINPEVIGELSVPENVQMGYSTGDLNLKGSVFDMLNEVADNVDFVGVIPREAVFTLSKSGDIAWDVKFAYYVKKDNGSGIKGSDSTGLSNNVLGEIKNPNNDDKK